MSGDPIRVLVCGGRNYIKWHRVLVVLGEIHAHRRIGLVISGHAKGADKLGENWAKINKVECMVFPADWDKHKKAAGGIRNQQMLDEGKPQIVVAFPGGVGTADMIRRAKKAGVPVARVEDL